MVDINHEQNFITHAVGEQFYTDNIRQAFTHHVANSNAKNRVIFVAELVQETDNPYDVNAVGIYSEFGKLGHLSRDHAIKYRKDYKSRPRQTIMVSILWRGLDYYLVYVDLPYTDDKQWLRPSDIEYLKKLKREKKGKGFFARLFNL